MDPQDQDKKETVPTPSELSSLEGVRTTLAGDVVQFLAVTTPSTTRGCDASAPELSNASAGQRQVLLRAAVADLEAMDERLHHARS